jgi:hypothetical protein
MKNKHSETGDENNVATQLASVKNSILKEMPIFGRHKDKLQRSTEWLQRALNLEHGYEKWISETTKLLNEGSRLLNDEAEELPPAISKPKSKTNYGGKERADQFRMAYLHRESSRGKPLAKASVRGTYFKNSQGLILGITFSSELKPEKRWWVNWKQEADEVVILCGVREDAVRVVHLPQKFFQKYGRHFHSGPDGLIQLTIREKDARFFAVLTEIGSIDISEFVNPALLICPPIDPNEFI